MNTTTTDKSESRYTDLFFSDLEDGSLRSAREALPHVLNLVACNSAVDVGCGLGAWLRVLKDLGVRDVLGLDGDYVKRERLHIAPHEFRAVELTAPPSLNRRFDLALSLEVAEHLPSAAADSFVEFLTGLAPMVLFSAAVEGQGGTAHINEQWPEYWADKFAKRGFVLVDCLRERLWQNANIEWWYAQNMFLYVHPEALAANPGLKALPAQPKQNLLDAIHPRALAASKAAILDLEGKIQKLEKRLLPENMHFWDTVCALPTIFNGAVKRRFRH